MRICGEQNVAGRDIDAHPIRAIPGKKSNDRIGIHSDGHSGIHSGGGRDSSLRDMPKLPMLVG
jgi:hypothetical protein